MSPLATTATTTAASRAVILGVLLFRSLAAAQSLPYMPTTLLLPKSNSQQNTSADVVYIFTPRDDTVDLLSLNISTTLDAASLSLHTLTSSLPFLSDSSTAFTPSLADNGSIIVHAGDCASSAKSQVWTYDPITDGSEAIWSQEPSSTLSTFGTVQMGPGFLGAGFSFSLILEPEISPADMYVYGGMCPSTETDGTSDQSNATYSNQMVKITPSETDTDGYSVALVENQGPPVAEAGFTFSALSPSTSSSSGSTTQQVNYVLLGGHTRYAFVNMSTAAIWSLPEESWGFIDDIGMSSAETVDTELAVKSTQESIDSRSGHTAVLNAEGTKLTILGGWVGDLSQAASPQLAVLEVGAGYGGLGDWQWSVPDEQPSGPGIYGHGAELLPGDVMMVYGGYSIGGPGSTLKRQSNNIPMFLNLTSMSWSESYVNPSHSPSNDNGEEEAPPASGSVSDETKRRLGLGLGLGLGLAAIIAAILVYLCYRRRLKHRRTIRDSQLQALAQDDSRFIHEGEMMEQSGGDPFAWYSGGHDAYGRGGNSIGYESLRSGRGSMDQSNVHHAPFWGDMPPAQVRRKPVVPRAARGQYQPTPMGLYDAPSNTRDIHPIYEADEDDGDIGSEPISPIREAHHHPSNRDSGAYSDPFASPVNERPISFPAPSRASQSPSPERLRREPPTTDPEVQDWMTDVDTADALLSGRMPRPGGRGSPTRRGTVKSNKSLGGYAADDDGSRTGSNISESNRSNLSGGIGRSSSGRQPRSGFGVAALATAAAALEGRGGSSSSSSAPSYNTARTSFHALQAEGPSLLMGGEGKRRKKNKESVGAGLRDEGNGDDEYDYTPGSPSKSKPSSRRTWLGSLRRVFSGPSPSSSDRSVSPEERRESNYFAAESSDYDARMLGGLGGIAAGGLLRRKGGKGAWAEGSFTEHDGGEGSRAGYFDYYNGSGGRGSYGPLSHQDNRAMGGDDDDGEWDIEKAVEKRLVQVMFTVPKERLRVVNAEPDLDGGESAVLVDPDDENDEGLPFPQQDHGESSQRRFPLQSKPAAEAVGAASGSSTQQPGGVGAEGHSGLPPTPILKLSGDEESPGTGKRGTKGHEAADSALEKEIDLLSQELELSRKKANNQHEQQQQQQNLPPPTPPASAPRLRGGGGDSTSSNSEAEGSRGRYHGDDDEKGSLAAESSISDDPFYDNDGGEGRSGRPTSSVLLSSDSSDLGGTPSSVGVEVFSAEAVRLERPRRKTRVLAMVDDIESTSGGSRCNSPGTSPVRGGGGGSSSPGTPKGSPARP